MSQIGPIVRGILFGAIGAMLVACGPIQSESTIVRIGSETNQEDSNNDTEKTNKTVLKEIVQNSAFVLEMNGSAYSCYDEYDIYINSGYQLQSYLANKLLSEEAIKNKVKVRVSSNNDYGTITVNYMDPDEICLIWSETLDMREFLERVGLNPVGIVKVYEAKQNGERNEASEGTTKG